MLSRMLLLSAVVVALPAQSDAPLAFEVASIKVHDTPRGFHRRPWSAKIECPPFQCGIAGTRFTEYASSLVDLIMDAYRVRRYQVVGLPDWGDSGRDVYDLAAKVAGDQPPTLDQVRRMLQTLLADRFQLKIHRETRELPAYALVIAKGGSKLKPCDADDQADLRFANAWERIPEVLGMFADRPVFDKTGYEGYYCTAAGDAPMRALDLGGLVSRGGGGRAAGVPPGPEPESTTNIFTEVQQKWGMKLEAQKVPVDVIVIDHVARPSAN